MPPREDFCERSSRNLVDAKGVFIANFFIGGLDQSHEFEVWLKHQTVTPETENLTVPPREDFCERSSRNLVDAKGVFNANFFIGEC